MPLSFMKLRLQRVSAENETLHGEIQLSSPADSTTTGQYPSQHINNLVRLCCLQKADFTIFYCQVKLQDWFTFTDAACFLETSASDIFIMSIMLKWVDFLYGAHSTVDSG